MRKITTSCPKQLYLLKIKPIMKEITKTLVIVFLIAFTYACGGDDEEPDTKAPEITIIIPVVNQEFGKGGVIPLKAVFKDDRELSKCTVSLSFNALKGISDPYAPKDIVIPLSGSTDNKDLDNIFTTPIDELCKSGSYTIVFIIEDAAGNVSDKKTVDISIQ